MSGAGWALATWIAATSAPAERRVELQWIAPPPCPDGAAVTRAAEALMLEHDAALRADAVVTARDDGFAMILTIHRDDGVQQLEQAAPQCETLADLAALLLAVAADPIAVTRARTPEIVVAEPPARSDHDPRPTASAVPERDAVPPAAPRKRPSGWLRIAGIAGIAELPRVDAGIGLTGAIDFEVWRIEIGVAHLFARQRGLPGYATARAELAAWNLQLRGCGELGRGALRIGGCIGPERARPRHRRRAQRVDEAPRHLGVGRRDDRPGVALARQRSRAAPRRRRRGGGVDAGPLRAERRHLPQRVDGGGRCTRDPGDRAGAGKDAADRAAA